jgi:hypothetical protein
MQAYLYSPTNIAAVALSPQFERLLKHQINIMYGNVYHRSMELTNKKATQTPDDKL